MFTLILAAWVQTLERDVAASQHAEAGVRLANERSFALYGAIAQAIRGWALAQRGKAAAGVSAIAEGLRAHQASGARVLRPFLLTLLAEAQIAAGHADDALVSIDDALAEVAVTDERFYEAEMHRLRGELLIAHDNRDEAETSLQRAIAVAHQQGALLLERRADASLAAHQRAS
jgi:predicted ATPase